MDLKELIKSLVSYRLDKRWLRYHKTIDIALDKVYELTDPLRESVFEEAVKSLYNLFLQFQTDSANIDQLEETLKALRDKSQINKLKEELPSKLKEIKDSIHTMHRSLYLAAIKTITSPETWSKYIERIILAIKANNTDAVMTELTFFHSFLGRTLYTEKTFQQIPFDKFLVFLPSIFEKAAVDSVDCPLLQDFVDALQEQRHAIVKPPLQTTLKIFSSIIQAAAPKPKENFSDNAAYIHNQIKKSTYGSLIKHAVLTLPLNKILSYVRENLPELDIDAFSHALYAYEMEHIDDVLAAQLIVQKKLFVDENQRNGLTYLVHASDEAKMKADVAHMLIGHIQNEIFKSQWGKEGRLVTVKNKKGSPINKVPKEMVPLLDKMEGAVSKQAQGIDVWEQTLHEVIALSKATAEKNQNPPSCFSACMGRKKNQLASGFFKRFTKGEKPGNVQVTSPQHDTKCEVEMRSKVGPS